MSGEQKLGAIAIVSLCVMFAIAIGCATLAETFDCKRGSYAASK